MASGAELAMILRAKDEASKTFDHVKGSAGGMASGVKSAVGGLVSGFGALGLAAQGVTAAFDMVKGVGSAFGIGALSELEQTRAQFMAFTKDAGQTEKILADVRAEAAKTPFAFGEMAKATAALLPVSKTSKVGLMELVKEAEILAASNPMEGLEGASFALKEAMTGDFTSIIERFNLSRSSINQWKTEGKSNIDIVRLAMKEMGLDADLVGAMGETLAGRWSTFQDTLQTLQMTVGQPIFDVLKESLMGLQGTLDENMPAIQGFAEMLAGGIGQGIEAAKTAIGSLIETWNSLSAAFSEGGIMGALEALGPMLSSALANLGNLIVTTVEGWATSFAAWVDGASEQQGGKLSEMFEGLKAWISEAVPAIVGKLVEWGEAFVGWVAPKIPPLLAALGGLLIDLGAWIGTTALPAIVSKLLEWGAAFVAWVGPQIPPLLLALGGVLLAIGGWIIGTALPAIVSKLLEWGTAFVDWIATDVLPKLPGALAAILSAIGGWVGGAVGELVGMAARLGQSIIDGIVNGIRAGVGAITSAARGAAQSALDAAKAALGVESPSRVFREQVGRMIPAGLIQGMDDLQGPLNRRLAGLVQPTALSPSLAGGGFGGGGGGVTINVYAGTLVHERELPRVMTQALGEGLRRGVSLGRSR